MTRCDPSFTTIPPRTDRRKSWSLHGMMAIACLCAAHADGQEFDADPGAPLNLETTLDLATGVPVDPSSQACRCGCGAGRRCLRGAGWLGALDYLWVRPHFSEAVAFARGSQSPASFQTVAEELEFNHDSSIRAFVGRRLADGRGAVKFTYWYLDGDTTVSGTVGGPGQFIIDPFGNAVGTIAIIDPGDARFPGGSIMGGDAIATRASVRANVYDIDFLRAYRPTHLRWDLEWSVGARIASIDQYYESVVTTGGAVFSQGEFAADFIGAGPRVGIETGRYFGGQSASTV